jgi:hypothetical protein
MQSSGCCPVPLPLSAPFELGFETGTGGHTHFRAGDRSTASRGRRPLFRIGDDGDVIPSAHCGSFRC